MYALKGSGRFYKAGLPTSSSHDRDTKSGANTHHPTINSSKKCNQDSFNRNGENDKTMVPRMLVYVCP